MANRESSSVRVQSEYSFSSPSSRHSKKSRSSQRDRHRSRSRNRHGESTSKRDSRTRSRHSSSHKSRRSRERTSSRHENEVTGRSPSRLSSVLAVSEQPPLSDTRGHRPITLSVVGSPAPFDTWSGEGEECGAHSQEQEYVTSAFVTADLSAKERVETGRQFAYNYLPPSYFSSSDKKRDKRFVPLSDFIREPPALPAYPVSVIDTVESFSNMLKERRDSSIPLSSIEYPAIAYRPAQPRWAPESDYYAPFPDVNKDAIPVALRRSMQASAALFDIVAYMKSVAEAQVKALQQGLNEEDDETSFQASCEAMAQAASDVVAMSTLAMTNATLHVRSRILYNIKMSSDVREKALHSQLAPDAWFGPAAMAAVEEDKKDPLQAARVIGGTISGLLARSVAVSQRRGTTARGSFRGSFRGNRGAGRGAKQLFGGHRGAPFATSYRGRSRGRGRGAGRPAATATSGEH